MCEIGDMTYEIILSKPDEETVVIPELGSNLMKMVNYAGANNNEDHFKNFRVTHTWTCTECPNCQLEFYEKEDTDAHAKAMSGKFRRDL